MGAIGIRVEWGVLGCAVIKGNAGNSECEWTIEMLSNVVKGKSIKMPRKQSENPAVRMWFCIYLNAMGGAIARNHACFQNFMWLHDCLFSWYLFVTFVLKSIISQYCFLITKFTFKCYHMLVLRESRYWSGISANRRTVCRIKIGGRPGVRIKQHFSLISLKIQWHLCWWKLMFLHVQNYAFHGHQKHFGDKWTSGLEYMETLRRNGSEVPAGCECTSGGRALRTGQSCSVHVDSSWSERSLQSGN